MSEAEGTAALPHDQLRLVPGAPEVALGPEDLAQLPAGSVPPPWDFRMDGVLWIQRAVRDAGAVLPSPLRRRRGFAPGFGGLVAYRESPVGPYREMLASPTLIRGGLWRSHVPFIAVDDAAGLYAGRAHWAFPKSFATFSGDFASPGMLEARGTAWWLRSRVRTIGPRVPFWLRISFAQVWPDGSIGSFPVTFRGWVRLGQVEVAVAEEASFAAWLRPGRHLAFVLTDTRVHLPAARRAHH